MVEPERTAHSTAKPIAQKEDGNGGEGSSHKRPTTAPKPQLDIKSIIKYQEQHLRNCISRELENQASTPSQIKELREQMNKRNRELLPFRAKLKIIEGQMSGTASGSAQTATSTKHELQAEARDLKTQIKNMLEESDLDEERVVDLAFRLPNLSKSEVPSGKEPQLVGYINEHLRPPFQVSALEPETPGKSHVDIGAELDILDFVGSAKTSGWGWYFLKNEAAFLEQALIQYSLSIARQKGWTVMTPPSMVYSHIAAACGFQPRDKNNEEHIYRIHQPATDSSKPDFVMTGTAEIPFAGMNSSSVFKTDQLPLKVIGASRCYRAEAGGRGGDTKGLYRVHEFTKVEMFAWTMPEILPSPSLEERMTEEKSKEHKDQGIASQTSSSNLVFQEMLDIQKEILSSLGLFCRILEMPASDLGASAARKQDIEAYFPSRRLRDQGFGEVTSASQCTDYQTRRLNTRIRKPDSKLDFPHTVNGTALAVPRVLAAILENGWNEERSTVTIPKVLRPWMGGAVEIERNA
jgi:seryl-tRNA synthetase